MASMNQARPTQGQDDNDLVFGHTQRRPDLTLGGGPFGPPYGFQALPYVGDQMHPGYPDASDTYRWGDQGTAWPMDKFTAMIADPAPDLPISQPVAHSYDTDANMEAYQIAGPYAYGNERGRDVGAFTGATGPTGHTTPMNQPELTAPQSPSTVQDLRPGGHPSVL